jgi:hypothetical protein
MSTEPEENEELIEDLGTEDETDEEDEMEDPR